MITAVVSALCLGYLVTVLYRRGDPMTNKPRTLAGIVKGDLAKLRPRVAPPRPEDTIEWLSENTPQAPCHRCDADAVALRGGRPVCLDHLMRD